MFSITHRNEHYILWNQPDIRDQGFDDVVSESDLDHTEQEKGCDRWYKGFVPFIGADWGITMRLMKDTDRGFSLLNPRFKLDGTFHEVQAEIVIPRLNQNLLKTHEFEGWPIERRIQCILRALGMRPPHRTFLADFPLSTYVDIRRTIMTSVMVHNKNHFQSLLRKMSCVLWMESCSEIISECIANFFKMCRQRLDSCGLVVLKNFYSSIEKQRNC